MGLKPLTEKRIKNPKNPGINDLIILKGHDANHNDFFILSNGNNVFKLQLNQKMKFSIKDFFSKCDQIRKIKGVTGFQNVVLFVILFILLGVFFHNLSILKERQ